MTIEMTDVGPKLSEADIAGFEQRIGSSLPKPYRKFLLAHNGGRPKSSDFAVPGWNHPESLVNDFYGIIPGKSNDLDENIEVLEGRLPKGFIPIADDPGGNAILISLDGSSRGRVYFWDHEHEPMNATENIADYPNIHLLAKDFDAFLSSLRGDD